MVALGQNQKTGCILTKQTGSILNISVDFVLHPTTWASYKPPINHNHAICDLQHHVMLFSSRRCRHIKHGM